MNFLRAHKRPGLRLVFLWAIPGANARRFAPVFPVLKSLCLLRLLRLHVLL